MRAAHHGTHGLPAGLGSRSMAAMSETRHTYIGRAYGRTAWFTSFQTA
jgi:hypothetical protein